jgi:hypothetical protein
MTTPQPKPLPKTVAELKRREPTKYDELICLLDEIESGCPESEQVSWVQTCLDYFGHCDAATRLGTAADDWAAAIKYAYDVLDPERKG